MKISASIAMAILAAVGQAAPLSKGLDARDAHSGHGGAAPAAGGATPDVGALLEDPSSAAPATDDPTASSGGLGGLGGLGGGSMGGGAAGGLGGLGGGAAGGSGGLGGLLGMLGGGAAGGSGTTGAVPPATTGSGGLGGFGGLGGMGGGASGGLGGLGGLGGGSMGGGAAGGLGGLGGGATGGGAASGGAAGGLGGLGGGATGGGAAGGAGGLGGLLGGLGGGGAGGGNDIASGAACKGATLIFARGTGEPGGTMGTIIGPGLASNLKTNLNGDLAVQGVDYPADAAGNANLGNGPGATKMVQLAQQAIQKCPQTKLVLSGYSQGAMVVHASLGKGIPAANVGAVVVFGDPLNGGAFTGVANNKVVEVCGGGDFLCSAGGNIVGSGSHLSYGSTAASSAQKVAAILKGGA